MSRAWCHYVSLGENSVFKQSKTEWKVKLCEDSLAKKLEIRVDMVATDKTKGTA